jgi:hypothetical protein
LQREKKTLRAMLGIYCSENHETTAPRLCDDCTELWAYAEKRLDKCPFGPDKGPCSKCRVHCYKADMRMRIQEVMRYSGPRMLKKHPIMAARHLLQGWKRKKMPKKKE